MNKNTLIPAVYVQLSYKGPALRIECEYDPNYSFVYPAKYVEYTGGGRHVELPDGTRIDEFARLFPATYVRVIDSGESLRFECEYDPDYGVVYPLASIEHDGQTVDDYVELADGTRLDEDCQISFRLEDVTFLDKYYDIQEEDPQANRHGQPFEVVGFLPVGVMCGETEFFMVRFVDGTEEAVLPDHVVKAVRGVSYGWCIGNKLVRDGDILYVNKLFDDLTPEERAALPLCD